MTRPDRYEVVAVYGGRPAGEIARGVLGSHGIEAELLADDEGGLVPVAALTEGVRITVRADRAAEARALLASGDTEPVAGRDERRPGSGVRLTAGLVAGLLIAGIVYSFVQLL